MKINFQFKSWRSYFWISSEWPCQIRARWSFRQGRSQTNTAGGDKSFGWRQILYLSSFFSIL